MKNRQILVVDDDRAVCASLKLLLTKAGYQVQTISHPRDIEETMASQEVDIVLLDMNFSIETTGRKGLTALKLLKSMDRNLPIILMTGWATVQLAVEGMKLGAADFIAKPWQNRDLLESIRTLLKLHEAQPVQSNIDQLKYIVGEDPKIIDILQLVNTVADTKANVLILGESGTGKELVAEAIHYSSSRAQRPFVKVNLGGLSTSLFESELFGHKKGAFTDASSDREGRFKMADQGTIFLDEIGELDLDGQVKLLRVLQESTFEPLGSSKSIRVDVRVIAATNRDLETMVSVGTFREDLYYRLNLVTTTLPPLRDRRGDISILAHHFLNVFKGCYEKPDLEWLTEAVSWLTQQKFQGNIRQLKNLVEKCVIFSTTSPIGLDMVQSFYRDLEGQTTIQLPEVGDISLEDLEKQMIIKALNKYNNRVADAARALGITRSSFYRRLEKYGLSL